MSYIVRGIAEPLSATYISAYLARVGNEIDPSAKDYLLHIVNAMYIHWDAAITYGHSQLEGKKYFELLEPAIDWIFFCLGTNGSEKHFKRVIKLYNSNSK